MPRRLAALLALVSVLALAPAADAAAPATYLVPAGGTVRAVRVLDVDGDGRKDLIAHVLPEAGPEAIVVLRTPATPVKRSLYPAKHVVRIPCTGARARAGAVAVGRFGPKGAVRIRFLGPDGVEDVKPDGSPGESGPRHARPTLLARSAGRELVFWDAVADLDRDGGDECWFPDGRGDGLIRIFGSTPAADRTLSIHASNRASANHLYGILRTAYVPNLFPADLDGDGVHELVALRDKHLVAWSLAEPAPAGKPLEPSWSLHLPFLEPVPNQDPEALRTPRIQLEDVDGDGITDLLVTVIVGKRTNLLSIRTILFHYPGPFRAPDTGKLVKPAARLDTQSIVLHPTFVDVDGDGAKEYVGDSIRGTFIDLLARLAGQDPKITYVGFRFDRKRGTYKTPWFTVERLYASKEALNNTFGRAAWLDGDFDGDGRLDMVDLGNLSSVTVLSGAGDQPAFDKPIVGTIPVKGGLAPNAQVADLNADGRADAVLWGDDKLYVLLSKGAK